MLNCSPEAFAKCPDRHVCGSIQDAVFMEGSDCDLFNQNVANQPLTNGGRIRSMNDEELAQFMCRVFMCQINNCPYCGARMEVRNNGKT